ncbi:MAG: hypothetical protein ACREPA_03915 [Candidatus Dormibacteraceae bacterium]
MHGSEPALPADFAAQLMDVLAPGAGAGAGAVIRSALALEDDRLAVFLRLVAGRLGSSPTPLTVAELRNLLRKAEGS